MTDYAGKGLYLKSKKVELGKEKISLRWPRWLDKNEFYFLTTTAGSKANELYPAQAYNVKFKRGFLFSSLNVTSRVNPLDELCSAKFSRLGINLEYKIEESPRIDQLMNYIGFV